MSINTKSVKRTIKKAKEVSKDYQIIKIRWHLAQEVPEGLLRRHIRYKKVIKQSIETTKQ